MNVIPGDVALVILGDEGDVIQPAQYEALREELGLNLPMYQRYFSMLAGTFTGNLGNSLWTGEPVWKEVGQRLPYTLMLIVLAVTISIILAVPIGTLAALKKDTWIDYILRTFAIAGLSMPSFWFGLLILLVTVSYFTWSPPLAYAPIYKDPGTALQQLVLPALVLGYRNIAVSSRMMRSAMLEVLQEDFVRTAHAKGLRERIVVYIHALRNAILPVTTVFGLEIIVVFSSAVIVETIFNIPGIGSLFVQAITHRDIVLVQGLTAVVVIFVLIINILVDVLYAWIDPRVRLR